MTALDVRLLSLFDHPTATVVGVLVALGVGAAHALAPGHGKTIAAAYLLGSRSRYRDAAALGGIVAIMHTASVLVLAIGWVAVSRSVGEHLEQVTAWMQVAAAGVVLLVGLHLVWRRFARTAVAGVGGQAAVGGLGRRHVPGAGRHQHGDAHDGHHPHGHPHSHTPRPGVEPWSRRGLTALGASGGLLPSPTAFLVLVSGLVSGRTFDALLLVLAFAVGLAATLTLVGVVTLRGRDLVLGRLARRGGAAAVEVVLPRVGAVAVAALGATYLAVSLTSVAAAG